MKSRIFLHVFQFINRQYGFISYKVLWSCPWSPVRYCHQNGEVWLLTGFMLRVRTYIKQHNFIAIISLPCFGLINMIIIIIVISIVIVVIISIVFNRSCGFLYHFPDDQEYYHDYCNIAIVMTISICIVSIITIVVAVFVHHSVARSSAYVVILSLK